MKISTLLMSSLFLLSAQTFANDCLSDQGHFAVANRGHSTISLVQAGCEHLIKTTSLKELGSNFEPMYINQMNDSMLIGDRKASQILIVDSKTLKFEKSISTKKGIFHMSTFGNKLAVATDVEKGFNLIEFGQNAEVISNRFFSLPSTITTGKPHDIIITDQFAFLSVLGVDEDTKKIDLLLQVDLKNLIVKSVQKFSEDIHLLNSDFQHFVVVEQETGMINFVNKRSFKIVQKIQGPAGVHGVSGLTQGLPYLFVTDINATDSEAAVLVYKVGDPRRVKAQLVATAKLAKRTAHNLAVTRVNSEVKIAVTHSGPASEAVSLLTFDLETETLTFEEEKTTGTNPFGISFIK